MLAWISENIATIIICVILLAAVIGKMVRDKKKGKSSCGCANCAMNGSCHSKK